MEHDLKKPQVSWFAGAQLNITENCIDRHLEKDGNKTAIIFEPNAVDEKAKYITYAELSVAVNKTANLLNL